MPPGHARRHTDLLRRAVQGVASRALGLFLAEETTRPLRGRVAETNPASRAVLRKSGFEEVGQDTGYAAGVGRVVTEYLYRLDAH